mmetsp:Transcript_62639/g.144233  ORF Transcript_62639/g.144233 Transcript_62639/m.144233 type:complete len:201 (+) Transcript_62639:3-605(+)
MGSNLSDEKPPSFCDFLAPAKRGVPRDRLRLALQTTPTQPLLKCLYEHILIHLDLVPLFLGVSPPVLADGLLSGGCSLSGTELSRLLVVRVPVDHLSLPAPIHDKCRVQDHSWTDLRQILLLRVVEITLGPGSDLVVPEPNHSIHKVKGNDVVVKRLGFGVVSRSTPNLDEELLHELQVRHGVKDGIEREEWSRPKQTVP